MIYVKPQKNPIHLTDEDRDFLLHFILKHLKIIDEENDRMWNELANAGKFCADEQKTEGGGNGRHKT